MRCHFYIRQPIARLADELHNILRPLCASDGLSSIQTPLLFSL